LWYSTDAAKNDLTANVRLLGNIWKLLHQILYTYLVDNYTLVCCGFPKLLYVYEIGTTPKFKFEFWNSPLLSCYTVINENIIIPVS